MRVKVFFPFYFVILVLFCIPKTWATKTNDDWVRVQVNFWKTVYLDLNENEFLIHDANDLSQIYARVTGYEQAKKLKITFKAPKGHTIRIQGGLKDVLHSGFQISERYLPRIQEILKESSVPESLSYLPFVESAFNHHAKSKVGALGIWQFMPVTASKDLLISQVIDERLDPLKASRAAGRYLRSLYDQFQNWDLAVMAYHHGPGTLERAIKKVRSRDPIEILKQYKGGSFGFASRNYLFEWKAMIEVGAIKRESKAESTLLPLPDHITVSFKKGVSLGDLVNRFHLNLSDFKLLNPHFLPSAWAGGRLIPAHYPIRLPGIKLEDFRKVQYP